MRDYRHPEYSKKRDRVKYQAKYNYYSLGLVLLEVGMWRTLSSLTRGKEVLTPEELRNKWLRYVQQLDFYVGKQFKEIVSKCLNGGVDAQAAVDVASSMFP